MTTRPAPAPATQSRIAFLDAIRGVAASLVVVQHALESQSSGFKTWSYEYVNLGRVGVVAFFLVSGYVIPLSLEKQSAGTFLWRRFFRLFPVYWVTLALFLLVAAGTPEFPALTVTGVGLNLLMVQGLVGGPYFLSPSWTLGIELFFYGQQLAAMLLGKLDRSVRLGWFWLACFLVFGAQTTFTGHRAPLALPLLLATASLGHAIYLRDRRSGGAARWLTVGIVIAVPVGSFMGVRPAADDWRPMGYALSYLVGLALFGGFYALRNFRLPWALTWLGAVSYAAYLAHPAVAVVINRLHHRQDWSVVVMNLVTVPIIAWLIHRYVELPCISYGRQVTARRRPVARESNRRFERR